MLLVQFKYQFCIPLSSSALASAASVPYLHSSSSGTTPAVDVTHPWTPIHPPRNSAVPNEELRVKRGAAHELKLLLLSRAVIQSSELRRFGRIRM